MRRRPWVLVLVGLLLPLPLLGIVKVLLSPLRTPGELAHTASGTLEISPILSVENRRELLTFERPCTKRADCEPPLGCLSFNGKSGFCVASECSTDLQCSDGLTCRLLPTLNEGPRVRSCITAGRLAEGEPCLALTMKGESSCARGLVCNGFCGRPCRLEGSPACPEGSVCEPGPSGPACMPTCQGLVCPSGQQCVHFAQGISRCAVPIGDDCQRTPCPEGQRCKASFSPGDSEWAALECVLPCRKEGQPCPEGLVCQLNSCRQPCDPKDPQACGPRRFCRIFQAEEEDHWLCGVAGN